MLEVVRIFDSFFFGRSGRDELGRKRERTHRVWNDGTRFGIGRTSGDGVQSRDGWETKQERSERRGNGPPVCLSKRQGEELDIEDNRFVRRSSGNSWDTCHSIDLQASGQEQATMRTQVLFQNTRRLPTHIPSLARPGRRRPSLSSEQILLDHACPRSQRLTRPSLFFFLAIQDEAVADEVPARTRRSLGNP